MRSGPALFGRAAFEAQLHTSGSGLRSIYRNRMRRGIGPPKPPLHSCRVKAVQRPPNRQIAGAIDPAMASRAKSTGLRHEAPRLYLMAPQDSGGLAERLTESLAAADIAAVLLRLPDIDERGRVNRVKALAPAVQDKGAALLIEGHPELAARAGADGAHLGGIEAFRRRGDTQARAYRRLRRDSRPATTPCSPRKPAPTTSCSASRTRTGMALLRCRRRACGLVGGSVRNPLRRLCCHA